MGMTLNERNPNIVLLQIGTQAATISLPGMHFSKRSRIKAVHYIDQAGIAADNTNFLQIALQDLAGNPYATLDTRAANQGAVTALTPIALALVGPDLSDDSPNTPLAQQEVNVPVATDMKIVVTKNGTGVPTLGQLQVEYYPL